MAEGPTSGEGGGDGSGPSRGGSSERGRKSGRGPGRRLLEVLAPEAKFLAALAASALALVLLARWLSAGRQEEGEAALPRGKGAALRVARAPFRATFRARGELAPLEEAPVAAPDSGFLVRLAPEGEAVRKGDVVVELDGEGMLQEIATRESEAAILAAELARVTADRDRRIREAEFALRREQVSLGWQRLRLEILLAGATPEERARSARELEARRAVVTNRETELAVARELSSRGFAAGAEVEKATKALRDGELDLERSRVAAARIEAGPTEIERKEAELGVRAAEYAVRLAEGALESVRAKSAAEVARAESRLKSEENSLALAREKLARLAVRSPADGFVLHASPPRWQGPSWKPGFQVWRGMKIMSVPVPGRAKVVTRLDQARADAARAGTKATVTIAATGGTSWEGRVSSVARYGRDENEDLDRATADKAGKSGRQGFEVEVAILAEDRALKPGLTADVEFLVAEIEDAIAVPVGAVDWRAGRPFVSLVRDGRPRPEEVKLGPSDGTRVVIAEGLSEGDVVLLAP